MRNPRVTAGQKLVSGQTSNVRKSAGFFPHDEKWPFKSPANFDENSRFLP
jgi:hypothetical protein